MDGTTLVVLVDGVPMLVEFHEHKMDGDLVRFAVDPESDEVIDHWEFLPSGTPSEFLVD